MIQIKDESVPKLIYWLEKAKRMVPLFNRKGVRFKAELEIHALLAELMSAKPVAEPVVHKAEGRGNWLRQHLEPALHTCYKNPEKRDDLVLRRSHGALAAFGRWLGKRRFTPEELLAMVDPAADEPTLNFRKSIQICENTEGRKGVAYNLVFRVSLRYEFAREIDDMGEHVILPEDEHYDLLLCDGYRRGGL